MNDDIRRYYALKNRCPVCNERNFVNTEIHILDIPPEKYIDKKNITICKTCGWRGYINELRP
jgi:uncharacterized protein with PIN domain